LRAAERRKVRDLVESGGRVTLEESRRAMTVADALLLVTATGGSGLPGSKVYEYAAAGPPVLAVPGDDEFVSSLFHDTGIGTCAATSSDVAAVLERLQSGELAGESWVDRSRRLAGFTWTSRAQRLSRLIDYVLGSRGEARSA
jgi:hypothetical protein